MYADLGCHDAAPRAIIDGNADWETITESTLGSVAWISGTGMRYNYSYMGMSVDVKSYSGMSAAEKRSALLALLDKHPEGIEIYDGSIPTRCFLTDYDADTDTFYCADPGTAAKRIKLFRRAGTRQIAARRITSLRTSRRSGT